MVLPDTLRESESSWIIAAGVVFFSILLTIPCIWLSTSTDIYINAVSRSDIVSRVDFFWQKPNRKQIEQEVLVGHYPLYEERSKGEWLNDVFGPVEALLEQAVDNCKADKLIERAAQSGLIIDNDVASTICEYVSKELRGGHLYSDIIDPAKQALYEWVYKQGVIDAARYAQEVSNGKHMIEIVDSGEHNQRGRLTEIGGEGRGIPVSSDKVGPLVKKGIYDNLFMLRPAMRTVLIEILTSRTAARPTLLYQSALTKARFNEQLENQLRQSSHVLKNSLLIAKGQSVTQTDFAKLTAENRAWFHSGGWRVIAERLAGKFLQVFCASVFFVIFFFVLVPAHRLRKLFGVSLLLLLLMGLLFGCLHFGIAINILPVGILAGMTAFACGVPVGMLTTSFFCLLSILLDIQQDDAFASFLLSGCFFAWLAPMQHFRMGLARISVISAVVAAIMVVAWNIGDGQSIEWSLFPRLSIFLLNPGYPLVRALWSAAGWMLSLAVFLTGMRSLRWVFGVTNNIILQDYQEHPLLTRLLTEAPSTYFHCTVTAALAEAGARAIGANTVLCRIASYYHDIGKLTKPEYFTENEKGISRHDALSPYMSNLIIIGHVKDGAEIARQVHLPPEIIQIIEQHHGTTQVGFFLRRAQEEARRGQKNVDENLFRYPGPKPQSQEAAIIMIADSVEAASRSMNDVSYTHIRELVDKITASKLNDHQLDACGLNFTDLAQVKNAIALMLTSMFHSRVSYDKKGK